MRIAGHLKVGMQERYSPLDRIVIPLCYNATRTMNTDEKILKALDISFAVLDNPEPLYLLELLGQTAFFGTPWGTQEYPRYRFNWLNTQHVSDAEEKVMRIKTGGCASFDPTETRVEPFNTRLEKRETNV